MRLSIAQFRAATQCNLEEPPIYWLPRKLSPYLSQALMGLGFSPNGVTFLWLLGLSFAAILLANAEIAPACALIILFYMLDCVDGEIARATKKPSRLGSQLEQVCHWVTGGILLSGAAWVQIVANRDPLDLFIFCAALIGNYAFYFVFYQLMLLMTPGHDYGVLHLLAGAVFYLMPLEVNLVLIFALLRHPWLAVVIWAVASNTVAIAIFALYYLGEKKRSAAAVAQSCSD